MGCLTLLWSGEVFTGKPHPSRPLAGSVRTTESFLDSGWSGMALPSSPANVRAVIGITMTEFPKPPGTVPLVTDTRQEDMEGVRADVPLHLRALPWNFLSA